VKKPMATGPDLLLSGVLAAAQMSTEADRRDTSDAVALAAELMALGSAGQPGAIGELVALHEEKPVVLGVALALLAQECGRLTRELVEARTAMVSDRPPVMKPWITSDGLAP
jgi:hypothetical protein